ncbi:type III-A CRISPR-associated RAMP protein Csm3 [Syntrophobacter fumaroxidans]|uniref:CRISPR system Cms endoribonuclease Csm3 n=1 Tax=Syntrophobacter fumaroxidans (strain DSM 10017 / MPOB) TaxID=335543 RepID=A0LHY6_SYNFM|nr:type III-A CRISPR-associated RAMP protein Csm3 [Syntrophobacter fumaroxidans]ABK17038.1 CRISPR-associated protein, Csm3 family [Syntrophobacter fumaroxidans MPOB]HOI94986.1 type III-A CRISPR-associated RAMP protein Csm3 [Syntrophobacter fumaroxidans]
MRLVASKILTGHIRVLTGLHIGAGKDAIEIGGVDSPVVKNPYTDEPYIPGSSLKGKLRCLMEWATNRVEESGKTWEGGGEKDPVRLAQDPVLRIFGTTSKQWVAGPTRLVVRDCSLNEQWRDSLIGRGLPFTEEKFENNIDRIQGKAGVGIRKTERVPAGAVFDLMMVYRVFDTGDQGEQDKRLFKEFLRVMRLLEHDALGGSGSRGYGRIKFENLRVDGEDFQQQFLAIAPEEIIQHSRS